MAIVKQRPEDFVVRERCSLAMEGGKHAVYQLTKRGLGTPEAIDRILTAWDLKRFQVAYAGLKDRHAVTTQTLTISDGPEEDLLDGELSLIFVGRTNRPIAAGDVSSNAFEVCLRGIPTSQQERILTLIKNGGLKTPNYFDSQRFGSIGHSGELIAKYWCLGNYEKALFLALAEDNSHDRPKDRGQKRILQEHWGEWQTCKDLLDRGHTRSVITYLVDHPTKFKKAFGLIRRDLRSLYVAALQSYIWNQLAASLVQERCKLEETKSLPSVAGELHFPLLVASSEIDETIPMPSGRKTDWPEIVTPALTESLERLGIQRHQLRVSYPRDVFFSRAPRNLWLQVRDLSAQQVTSDDPDEDESILQLHFELGKGQYATMLLKHIELLSAPL